MALDRAGKLDPKLGLWRDELAHRSPPPASSSPPDPTPSPTSPVVADLIRRARDAGADFIMTPEASNFIESGQQRRDKARREAEDPFLAAMRDLARETGAWILLGSLVIDPAGEPGAGDETRLANRSFLLDAQGGIVARYDKIHMFDIDLPNGESYPREQRLSAGRPHRRCRDAVGQARHDRVLRRALPASLSDAGAGRRRFPVGAVGVHGADRQGALAGAAARAGDRERRFRVRPGADRASIPAAARATATR